MKRAIIFILIMCILIFNYNSKPVYAKTTESVMLGDLNNDKAVTSADALLALQYSVKKITSADFYIDRADVNSDSLINATDALYILQYAVKKISSFEEIMDHIIKTPANINSFTSTDYLFYYATTQRTIGTLNTLNSLQEGTGSLAESAANNLIFQKNYTTSFDTKVNLTNGGIRFWLYTDNVNVLKGQSQLELSSSGTCDVNELSFDMAAVNPTLSVGWNLINIKFSQGVPSGGTCDLTAVNFVRLYAINIPGNTANVKIDNMEIVNIYPDQRNDVIYKTTIDNFDSTSGWSGAANIDTDNYQEGTGSLAAKAASSQIIVSKVFTTPFNTGVDRSHGALKFWLWVDNVDAFKNQSQLELTSSGTNDINEMCWTLMSLNLTKGWNYITLNFSDSGITGTPDLANINFVRLYTINIPGNNANIKIDKMETCYRWLSQSELPVLTTMPDPLVMSDGQLVKNAADWENQKPFLRAMMAHYLYGHVPEAPTNLMVDSISSSSVYGGLATQDLITLSYGPYNAVKLNCRIVRPNTTGTHPVDIRIDYLCDAIYAQPLEQEMVTQHGFVCVTVARNTLAADTGGRTGYAFDIYPQYDFGSIAIWGSSASRVLDYLETTSYVNWEKICVTGHSRDGKDALYAAAFDDRIAVAAPNGSGCGGCGSFRILGSSSETLDSNITNFPAWFAPEAANFRNSTNRLPFDMHFARALVAKGTALGGNYKGVINTDANKDNWSNPLGTQAMKNAAQSVYDLLGISSNNTSSYRSGDHGMLETDWRAQINFLIQLWAV